MGRPVRTLCLGAVSALASIAASPGPASAITFNGTFYGTIEWTAVSHCPSQKVGYTFTSEYHPRTTIRPSENYAAITTMYTFEGAAYRLSGDSFGVNFKPVSGIYTGSAWYPLKGTEIRLSGTTPSVVTADTEFLEVRGQIKSPWALQGVGGQPCVVTFIGNYFRGLRD